MLGGTSDVTSAAAQNVPLRFKILGFFWVLEFEIWILKGYIFGFDVSGFVKIDYGQFFL